MKKIILLFLMVLLGLVGCQTSQDHQDEPVNEVKVVDTSVNETAAAAEETAVLEAGKMIPNFMMENLEGDTLQLHDYQGKIILLNFWATWCPYCVQEMPALDAVNEYDDVVVLAINAKEDKQTIQDYLNGENYSFEVIYDEIGYFSDRFYINSLPVTFFINEEGILLGNMPTMMTKEQMDQIIQDIRDDVL